MFRFLARELNVGGRTMKADATVMPEQDGGGAMKTRQATLMVTALAMVSMLMACGDSSHKAPAASAVSVAVLSGSGQSTSVGTAFTAQLLAWVTSGGSPMTGVTVTFTAPTSGASGTFAGGVTTATATTDDRGLAASPVFTANTTTGTYAVTAAISGGSTAASFSLTNTASNISVALDPSNPTSMQTGMTMTLTAEVTNDPTGSGVTWSCTPLNSCGSFNQATSPGNTATTSYTAPAAVPSGGSVTITATSVIDTTASASANIAISAPAGISVSFNPAPPTTLAPGASTSLTATVANDSTSSGVTWSCSPSPSCGSFNPATSPGNTATTSYTAPAAIPSGGSVTITATAVQDTTASASANITITNAISVSFKPAPPSTLKPGASATLTAVVVNDATASGVTWSCTPVSSCGSFNPATSTGNTATTSYTAPATIPSGGSVTVTATSVHDTTASASANITITTSALADGTYVFTLNSRGGGNRVAGAFKVTNGTITGGEQDFNGPTPTGYSSISDLINGTGSSIANTANGNLEITLKTCNGTDCTSTDPNIGVSGIETLHATLVSSSRALIIEFDNFATASGSLDPQVSPLTAPAHGYAFFTSGFTQSFARLGIGGIVNVDGTASSGSISISGTGSVFDINTDNYAITQNQSFDPSSVTTPDAFGRVVFTLNPSAASGISPFSLVGYIVDPGHIHLVETTDTLLGITGGEALGQGTNTGNFNSTSISGSSFVFGATGGNTMGHFQMAGVLTANSGGTVSGTLNCNDLSGTTCPQPPTTFTGGAYTVDATGRVTLTNLTSNAFTLQLYLSGSGTGTVVSMDFTSDMVAGLAYQQIAGASFSGTYGMNATGFDSSQTEFDDVGPVTAVTESLTGTNTIDQNYGFPSSVPLTQMTGLSVSGSFTAFASGVLTGTITGLEVPSGAIPGNFTYYIVDSTRVVAIQTDTAQWTLINFELKQ